MSPLARVWFLAMLPRPLAWVLRLFGLLSILALVACGGNVDTTIPTTTTDSDAGVDSSSLDCPLQWIDADGDDDGAIDSTPIASCVPLTGYSYTHGDCDDDLAIAHSGGTDFFDEPMTGHVADGFDPFDYNCDHLTERRPGPVVEALTANTPCSEVGCR